MKKLIVLAIAAAFSAGLVHAQDKGDKKAPTTMEKAKEAMKPGTTPDMDKDKAAKDAAKAKDAERKAARDAKAAEKKAAKDKKNAEAKAKKEAKKKAKEEAAAKKKAEKEAMKKDAKK